MWSWIWKTSAIGIGQRLFKILSGMEINIPGFHGLSQVTTQVQCVLWKGTNSPTMGHFVHRANDTRNCRKPPTSRSLIQLKIISDLYYNPVQVRWFRHGSMVRWGKGEYGKGMSNTHHVALKWQASLLTTHRLHQTHGQLTRDWTVQRCIEIAVSMNSLHGIPSLRALVLVQQPFSDPVDLTAAQSTKMEALSNVIPH